MAMRAERISAAVLVALLVMGGHLGAAEPQKKKVGRVLLTFYWTIDESSLRYIGRRDTVLRDVHGKAIARTNHRFKRDLVMEGTGWLRDGRTVSYDCHLKGEHRFRVSRARYGLTCTGKKAIPYRTIAVDPRVIPLGSKVYIPQLKGTKLPDGTIHDGIFLATDRGHFRGRHIDIFVGAGKRSARPFIRKGYGSRSHVTAYVIK